jgi:hypothetical protein
VLPKGLVSLAFVGILGQLCHLLNPTGRFFTQINNLDAMQHFLLTDLAKSFIIQPVCGAQRQ